MRLGTAALSGVRRGSASNSTTVSFIGYITGRALAGGSTDLSATTGWVGSNPSNGDFIISASVNRDASLVGAQAYNSGAGNGLFSAVVSSTTASGYEVLSRFKISTDTSFRYDYAGSLLLPSTTVFLAFRSVDTVTPFDVTSQSTDFAFSNATAMTAPAITTVSANTYDIRMFLNQTRPLGNTASFTTPAGYTSLAAVSDGTGQGTLYIFGKALSAAGVQAVASSTFSNSVNNQDKWGASLALRAA